MKLSKEQALDLVKILAHYEVVTDSPIQDVDSSDLRRDLEEFILEGAEDCDEDCCSDEEDDDEETEDDSDEEEEDSSEEDEEDDEESGEDEESSEEDDDDDPEEEDLNADIYVLGSDLHGLKVAKGKIISSSAGDPDDEVTLEFENTEDDEANVCDLLVDGQPLGPITHVRRKGKELHVAESNAGSRAWHRFEVTKFPKGWADVLPLDQLAEVE